VPEYLAPGVYVEETSFRAKSIEGVGTSTTAFAGLTRKGPIGGTPEILTSFPDFERIYGGIDNLWGLSDRINYLAHAVNAFFDNGGSRLYVSRAFWLAPTELVPLQQRTLPMAERMSPSRLFSKLAFKETRATARSARRCSIHQPQS